MFKRKLLALVGATALLVAGMATPAMANPTAPVAITKDAADPSASAPVISKPPKPTANASKPSTGVTARVTRHGVPSKAKSGSVSTLFSATYKYVAGQDTPAAPGKNGIASNILVANPAVDTGDHSLMEITVQGGTNDRDILEMGWVKDSATGQPYLFISAWVNNVWCGSYVGAGTCGTYTDYGSNCVNVGVALNARPLCTMPQTYTNDVNTSKQFYILWDSANSLWWFNYNANWIGYIPGSIFPVGSGMRTGTGRFFQAFGEVFSNTGTSCTDMGTGLFGSGKVNPGTAYFGSVSYLPSGVPNMPWTSITHPTEYDAGYLSGRSAYIGGPGPC